MGQNWEMSKQDHQGNAGSQNFSNAFDIPVFHRALQVEQMGFQHFQLDVSIPRIAIFRPLDSKFDSCGRCVMQSLRYAAAHPAPRGSACRNSNSVLENIKPLVVGDRKGFKNHRFTSWGSIHTRSYNRVWGWECSRAKPLHSTRWYTQKEGLLTCSRSLARDYTLMISRHGR